MNRNRNYAPKHMNGDYNIHIRGNEVTLNSSVWNGPYKSVTVKCHPDDTFDIGEAVRIAMKRLDDEIRIGDTVKIVDNGHSYCVRGDWKGDAAKYAPYYRYGVVPKNNTICRVVALHQGSIIDGCLYVVKPVKFECWYGDNKYKTMTCCGVYVMSKFGLEKV